VGKARSLAQRGAPERFLNRVVSFDANVTKILMAAIYEF
jgi:hypothetical protein